MKDRSLRSPPVSVLNDIGLQMMRPEIQSSGFCPTVKYFFICNF